MVLTPQQRLIIYNQYEILKQLSTDDYDKNYYEERQKMVEIGCEKDWDELVEFLEESTESDVAAEVWDVLEMYRALYSSFKRLENVQDIKESDVLFAGFDGNEEVEHYAYADFLLHTRKRYAEFEKCELNSHCNRLYRYRPMVERFAQIKKNPANDIFFSEEQIKFILDK